MAETPIEALPRLTRLDQLIQWAKLLTEELDKRWYSVRNPMIRRISTSDVSKASDYIILCFNGNTDITLTLNNDTRGHILIVIKEDSGTGTITLQTTASGDVVIPAVYGSTASVVFDGLDWDSLQSGGGAPGPPGPAGPAGPAGATGATGATGAAGATGAIGPIGIAGDIGLDGDMGPPGAPGPVGPRGPIGFGVDGLDGEDGAIGPPGVAGVAGAPGAAGVAGAVGPPGFDGLDGEDALFGPPGAPGAQGAAGPVGPQGPQGPMGLYGEDGEDAMFGPPGSPGPGVNVNTIAMSLWVLTTVNTIPTFYCAVIARQYLIASGQKLTLESFSRFRVL